MKTTDLKSKKAVAPPDCRTDLLDSIRNSSQRGLKKVQTVNKTDSQFDKEGNSSSNKPGKSVTGQNMLKSGNGNGTPLRKRNPIEDQLNSVLSNFVMPTKK